MSSEVVIRNCHQKLSSKFVIRNCHQKLSSEIVIRNFHQKLSSEIVIGNCHQKLSSKIFIKNFHQKLSLEIVIRNCHQKLSFDISCHLTFHVISVILVFIEITVNKVITASKLKVVVKDRCVFKKWPLPLPLDSHRAVSRIELLRS